MADVIWIINEVDHIQDNCSSSAAVSSHNVCPLETANAVKNEPPDVPDDVCSTDVIANVKMEASTISDEVNFAEIDTAVKIEPLDLKKDVCSLDGVGNVKSKCSDVQDEVCPLDTAAMVKLEVNIGPTMLQPHGRMLSCKHYDQVDCRASSSTLHNALAQNVCPLETATAVKNESHDVTDVGCSTNVIENVKAETSTVSDEVYFPEEDISVKIEPLDVNEDVCSLDGVGNVKSLGSEVRDEVCPLDTAAVVNLDVRRLRSYKSNPENISQMESHRLGTDTVNITRKQENVEMTGSCGVQYYCNVCSKSFTLESAFQRHMITHTGEDNYNICNTNFVTEQNTPKKRILTQAGRRPHRCAICSKGFSQYGHWKNHMLTHTGERPHRCDICSKNFSQQGHLASHKLTHTGVRPHRCDVCNRNFSLKGSLKRHMSTHTGIIRPHRCDVCDKNFSEKKNLKSHMLGHTGERPHRCDICSKDFSQQGHLISHKLTHTGERPHRCDVCNRNFSQKSTLKRHMLTHKGI